MRCNISLTKTDQFFFWPSGCLKCLFVFLFSQLPEVPSRNPVWILCFWLFLRAIFWRQHTFCWILSFYVLDHMARALQIEMTRLQEPCTWNALHTPRVNNKQQSCRCALHTSAVCAFVAANNMQIVAAFVKIRCQSGAPWLPQARASRELPGLISTVAGCTEYSRLICRVQGRRGDEALR